MDEQSPQDRLNDASADVPEDPKDKSPSADALPAMPTKDGSPLGSTDQHSDA